MAQKYYKIPATQKGRVEQFRSMLLDAIRIKKELSQYFNEHHTTLGYDPDKTYAKSL